MPTPSLMDPPVRPAVRSRPDHLKRTIDVAAALVLPAQVSGRNSLSWEAKLDLDVRYVDSRNLRGDLAILLATLRTVLGRDGISAAGTATAPECPGTRSLLETARRDRAPYDDFPRR